VNLNLFPPECFRKLLFLFQADSSFGVKHGQIKNKKPRFDFQPKKVSDFRRREFLEMQ